MDSSQRALQTNGKLFSNIWPKTFFFWPKTVNIDQIEISYISMDSSQRALQTNEKLFSNSKLVFEILTGKLKVLKIIKRREY